MTKRGPGRPKKPPATRKSHVIRFRVAETEADVLYREALRRGLRDGTDVVRIAVRRFLRAAARRQRRQQLEIS